MMRAIFILGMHRSGTSALARVVNLLGAELGNDLMQAAEDNKRGFWEHEGAVQLHELLLRQLGHGWHDGHPLSEGWQETAAAKEASAALAAMIEKDFSTATCWAIKDPRLSLLFPLWRPLLTARKVEASCIIAWRNPAEVAASLHKRDGLELEEALLCWLAYTLESLQHAQSCPHTVLSYDALLQDWQSAMMKAGKELALEWPVAIEEAAPAVEAFLSTDLRHHQKPLPAGDGPIFTMVRDCVALLEGEENSPPLADQLARWRGYSAGFAPSIQRLRLMQAALEDERDHLQREVARHQHHAEDMEQQFAQLSQTHKTTIAELIQARDEAREAYDILQAKFSRLVTSTSWKMTKPLRQVRAVIKGEKLEDV
jgi:hypothetical protein